MQMWPIRLSHWRSICSRDSNSSPTLSRTLVAARARAFTLTLPPADASELPALVASEIEQQIGEADESPVIDFHVVPSTANPTDATAAAASNGVQVLAFALPIAVQQRLQSQVSGAGFRIAAICSRHLSPLGVLRRKHVPEGTPAVSVHLYAGEAELAICRGSEPVLLRSIRVNLEEPSQVAEQILLESQRCLALLPHEFTELPFNWFIYTTCEAAWQVAQALDDHDQQIAIQPVDPLIGWEVESPNDSSAAVEVCHRGQLRCGMGIPQRRIAR